MLKQSWFISLLIGVLFITGSSINDGYSFFSLQSLISYILYLVAYFLMQEPLNQYYNKQK